MQTLARGTLSQASVYPREVVRAAIERNAANVIFAHNHPSGSVEPSHADRRLTTNLKDALALIEVHVLDHCIVGHLTAPMNLAMPERPGAQSPIYSMAQMGDL